MADGDGTDATLSTRTSLWGVIKHGLSLWRLYSKAVDKYHDKGGKAMLDYILNRLGEASTWRGIILLATALGATFSPEQTAAIITFGLGLAGVIGAFFKDKGN